MSTEGPAAISVSAPAGTRAMRFSFVLISFGTPIFMGVDRLSVYRLSALGRHWRRADESSADDRRTESRRTPGIFAALKLITRPERHNRLLLGREKVARHAGDLLWRHRVDERE